MGFRGRVDHFWVERLVETDEGDKVLTVCQYCSCRRKEVVVAKTAKASGILFRIAEAKDLPSILLCLHPFGIPVADATVRQTRGSGTYVAVINGQVCGTARMEVFDRLVRGKDARIEDVAVLPSQGRKGVGTALVAHLVGLANMIGCYKVQLTCHPNLEKWYSKMGFRRHEVNMRVDLPIGDEK
jgi:GNAT superfamily N-acetyltransferase